MDANALRQTALSVLRLAELTSDPEDASSLRDVPARIHRADLINEVFGGAKLINAVLAKFKTHKRGVIVYLRDGTAGVPVTPIPGDARPTEAARTKQWREVGLGAQILKDLGISSINLLSSTKTTYVGLPGFGIGITKTESIEI